MGTYIHEDDGEHIYISMNDAVSATARIVGPDDDGTAGASEPVGPEGDPPSLATEAVPDHG
jgi:hypothetical protein